MERNYPKNKSKFPILLEKFKKQNEKKNEKKRGAIDYGSCVAAYTPTSSLYTPGTNSIFTPISSGLSNLGGSSTPGAIGSGRSSIRPSTVKVHLY